MTTEIFFYRKEGNLQRIDIDKVLALEAADNYVKFYTLEYVHLVRISLNAAIRQLPPDRFMQVHRSFAVALAHIDTIGKDFLSIIAAPGSIVPVSKKYYAALLEKIRIIEEPPPQE